MCRRGEAAFEKSAVQKLNPKTYHILYSINPPPFKLSKYRVQVVKRFCLGTGRIHRDSEAEDLDVQEGRSGFGEERGEERVHFRLAQRLFRARFLD